MVDKEVTPSPDGSNAMVITYATRKGAYSLLFWHLPPFMNCAEKVFSIEDLIMTWELHSPDLPFLNEITVIQNKHGFWENISSYAPVLSAFFALISLFVTL